MFDTVLITTDVLLSSFANYRQLANQCFSKYVWMPLDSHEVQVNVQCGSED